MSAKGRASSPRHTELSAILKRGEAARFARSVKSANPEPSASPGPGAPPRAPLAGTHRRNSRGSTVVEFTMAGIPLILVFVSIMGIGFTMFTYQTLSYATQELNRYIAVHGKHCSSGSNSCTLTVGSVATAAENYALGLTSSNLVLTLTSPSTTYTCNPVSSCTSNSSQWPPSADSSVGTLIQVRMQYQVSPALTVFWPYTPPAVYGSYNLGAYSKQRVLF